MKTINNFINEKLKITKKMLNNQYNYVDLGLPSGTLWADRNVGAKTETDCGDYFAWAETKSKKEYSWETYKFGSKNNLKKYNDKDKLTNIKLTDDTAQVIMGSDWSIPTKKQFQELIDNTEHEVIENYNNSNVDGMLFVSKHNDNTIFLPCAGVIKNESNDAIYVDGLYWMSNIDPNDSYNAYHLYFWDTSLYTVVTDRCYGLSVRGVCIK
jgi:hypothetical protein